MLNINTTEHKLKGLTDQIYIKKIHNDKLKEIYDKPVSENVYVNGSNKNLYINFIIFNISKDIENDYQKIHNSIKNDIYKKMKEKDIDILKKDILYDYWVKNKNEYLVFYLSTQKEDDFNLIGDFNYNSLLRILLNSHFKGAVIKKIDNLEIDVNNKCFNNNLFVAVNSHNKFYNCFETRFYVKDEVILGIDLKYNAFVKKDENINIDEYTDNETNIIFTKFGKEEQINLKKIDGRKNPRKYFSQYKYKECKNFAQNWVLMELIKVLELLKIEHECISFNPNYIFESFFNIEKPINPELYIDKNINFNEYKDDIDKFKKVLGVENIKELVEYEDLSNKENVVLIDENTKGSYIYSKDENNSIEYNSTMEAFEDEKNHISQDNYTKIKIQHINNILNNKEVKVTQGVLIKNLRDDKKFKSVLNKLNNELFLKKCLFKDKKIDFKNKYNFNDDKIVCVYIRKTQKRTYFSVLECSILNECIHINNVELLKKEEFEKKYDYFDIKQIANKYLNDSFFMWSKGKILNIKQGFLPSVIGNYDALIDEDLNLIKVFEKNNVLHKKAGEEVNLLPFYLSRKNSVLIDKNINRMEKISYGKLYIEIKENRFRAFLTDNAQYGESGISKQNLIQEFFLYKENEDYNYEQYFNPDDILIKIYLNSLTFDVINIGETAKKSIFQKLTELIIYN